MLEIRREYIADRPCRTSERVRATLDREDAGAADVPAVWAFQTSRRPSSICGGQGYCLWTKLRRCSWFDLSNYYMSDRCARRRQAQANRPGRPRSPPNCSRCRRGTIARFEMLWINSDREPGLAARPCRDRPSRVQFGRRTRRALAGQPVATWPEAEIRAMMDAETLARSAPLSANEGRIRRGHLAFVGSGPGGCTSLSRGRCYP